MATELRESTFDDFTQLNLHPKNIEEIKVSSGIDPTLCLAILWEHSIEKVTVFVNDKPVCLFGIVKPNNFWLFFSADVIELPLSFFKESRKMVKRIHEVYGFVEGRIYEKNTFALEWAKFVGWTIDPLADGFYRFYCGKEG